MWKAAVLGMALALALPAAAQDKKDDEKKKPTAQQARMAECNKQASGKGLKGDERKAFMSGCLKDKPQARMAKCNKEAAGMKGEERKKFMSACLKG